MAGRSRPLRCEDCGYPLAGLDAEARCPECGRPVADSLPHRRTGSPWQRGPAPWAWVRTGCETVGRPSRLFRTIRISRTWGLLSTNILLAAAILADPWVGTLMGDPVRSGHVLARILSLLVGTAIIGAALLALTLLESFGLAFFSSRRGGSLGGTGALAVCSHASIGWVIASFGMWLSLAAWFTLTRFGISPPVQSLRGIAGDLASVGVPALGLAPGFVLFEWLSYRGARCCRFANRPAT